MNNMFPLYALEIDGELDTHFSKVRKIIKCRKQNLPLPADLAVEPLSSSDIMYIESVLESE